jgi:hypothetical protein
VIQVGAPGGLAADRIAAGASIEPSRPGVAEFVVTELEHGSHLLTAPTVAAI